VKPPVPCSLDAPPSIEAGRRWRSRHQKKTGSWWRGLVVSLLWVYAVYRSLMAFPLLPEIHESSRAFWEVVGSGLGLLAVSVYLLILAFKKA
jgi:hypothetical protein